MPASARSGTGRPKSPRTLRSLRRKITTVSGIADRAPRSSASVCCNLALGLLKGSDFLRRELRALWLDQSQSFEVRDIARHCHIAGLVVEPDRTDRQKIRRSSPSLHLQSHVEIAQLATGLDNLVRTITTRQGQATASDSIEVRPKASSLQYPDARSNARLTSTIRPSVTLEITSDPDWHQRHSENCLPRAQGAAFAMSHLVDSIREAAAITMEGKVNEGRNRCHNQLESSC